MRDLLIFGNPDIEKLKSAKASLGFSDLLRPVKVDGSTSFTRFLAWGDKPSGLGDYAYVTDKTSPEGLVAALRWVLTDEEDSHATTVVKTLTNIFGFGLHELDPVDMLAEKKARVSFSKALKLDESGDSYDR